MTYEEALKHVQAQKTAASNYMKISFSHYCTLVLPHKEGVALLTTLQCGEQLDDSYHSRRPIQAIDVGTMSVTLLPLEDYQRYKMATLLGITVDDLKIKETEHNLNPT